MELIILKTAATIMLILCLTWITEKASPRIAGILSGYPVGTALVLFFYGIEIGPDFAVASVPYNLLGHTSALVFVYCYFRGSRSSTVISIMIASVCAICGYAVSALVMSILEPTLLTGAAFTFSIIALFSFLFRDIPDTMIDDPPRYTPAMFFSRLILSSAIVLLITGVAQGIGVRWAGLFSAFPLVVYPLLILIHLNYGVPRAHTVIKNFPRGLWTVAAYSIIVSLTYGRLGVFIGTACGYLVATAVLLVINWKVFFTDITDRAKPGRKWNDSKI